MNPARPTFALLVSLVAAGCTSTPAHYHTLVAAPPNPEPASALSTYSIEVAPVAIPAEVDRLELVVRLGNGTVALLENELWAAPLADEVRTALGLDIRRRADRAMCTEVRENLQSLSLRVEIERFEAAPDGHALVQTRWQLRVTGGAHDIRVSRRSRSDQRVGPGYASLVDGYQRALQELAGEVADAALGALAEDGLPCRTG